MSLIMSRRTVAFCLQDWLRTDALVERELFAEHDASTFASVLALSEELATEKFAPHNRASDLQEPSFDGERVTVLPEVGEAVRAFADADLMGATFPVDAGGLQLPVSVHTACMLWFQAANVGTAGYPLLTSGNAHVLLTHAAPEVAQMFVPHLLSGRFLGTMALSEPGAGSNLADLTTRAERREDGTYRIFGQKMWISGGDHELSDTIVHLVLARLPDAPPGTAGISLFAVPKHLVHPDGSLGERNDVVLSGINHKLGWRGTVNTAPSFGEGRFTPGGEPGAVGYLVGEEHRGLRCMFTLMNEARIGVGAAAAGLAMTGYLKSLDYARSRPQGRLLGASLDSPQVPLVAHADVRRMLLAQKAYAEGSVALVLLAARLVDDERSAETEQKRREAGQLLALLTPVAKSWPSQWGLAANDLAIQVLGGAGYTRDHDVEQHWRDQRLNPIHEGTHGIQAQDLLGRKVLGDGGAALALLTARVVATIDRARTAYPSEAAALDEALTLLLEASARVGRIASTDSGRSLANATPDLEAFGHVVVAWIWLDLALATEDRAGEFFDGKRAAARWFARWELPRVAVWLNALDDETVWDLDPDAL